MVLTGDLQTMLGATLWHGLVVLIRVGAMVSVLPAFGERTVPVRVKAGVAVMFTLIVAPSIDAIGGTVALAPLARFALSETLVGLAFGLGIRLFILALQTAGSIAAQSTSLAQVLGGAAAEPMPAMGYVLVVAGLALAVMSGLHVQAARLLILSYDLFPPGRFPGPGLIGEWGVARISQSFALAFTLAAPFVIASLIYNLAMGVINRAMPQLMVAFVGAPLITWGGLMLLFLCAPALLSVWLDHLGAFLRDPTGMAR